MKKKLAGLILTFTAFVTLSLNAFAVINSTTDIEAKINLLNELSSVDLNSFFNKSEIIGDRLDTFNMLSAQYINEVIVTQENMRSIIKQIEGLKIDSDIPESEKNVQISKLYQEADASLFTLDSKTIQYLYSAKRIMPTITYQKYAKKFRAFYNNLDITNNNISSR